MFAVPPQASRWNIVPFWLAVCGRSLGENAIRAFILLALRNGAYEDKPLSLIFLWLCIAAVPIVPLAPLASALAGSHWRRGTMILGGFIGLGTILFCASQHGPWLSCFGILAVEGIFFSVSRQTMLYDAARQTRLSFPHLQAIFGLAGLGGALGGIYLALIHDPLILTPPFSLPLPVQGAVIGFGVMILGLLLTRFHVEPEWTPRDGLLLPFVRVVGGIFRDRYGRAGMILLVGWFAMFVLLLGKNHWLLSFESIERFGIALAIGIVVGGLMHWHPFRCSYPVPPVLTALFFFLLYSARTDNWTGPVWVQGILLGSVACPLLTLFQANLPKKSQANGIGYLLLACALVAMGMAAGLLSLQTDSEALDRVVCNGLLIVCGAVAIYAWIALFRPFTESMTETLVVGMQRIRTVGPGFETMPFQGPGLVIANHGAMLDPLWLCIMCPMRITPMMVSKFYDLPVIRWLMKHVMHTIRVGDSLFKRDAPEVRQAIDAINRGECVMIFPEGWLRRTEEVPMRRFSRGVWQILKACPNVPIFSCWIEGGWGSFFSFKGGELMKGKRFDFRHRITIAALAGRNIDPKHLEKHLQTRAVLMGWVLEARALLGLPPIDPAQTPTSEKDEEGGKGEA